MANGSAPTITLNNGVDIPQIGYGVFLTPPEETERAVLVPSRSATVTSTPPRPTAMRRAWARPLPPAVCPARTSF